jgi:hypothetical protein
MDYLRTRPGADVLYTSCADGPGSPRGFYLRYGFTDTGRSLWGENVLALDLRREVTRAGANDSWHQARPGAHVTGRQQVTGFGAVEAQRAGQLCRGR